MKQTNNIDFGIICVSASINSSIIWDPDTNDNKETADNNDSVNFVIFSTSGCMNNILILRTSIVNIWNVCKEEIHIGCAFALASSLFSLHLLLCWFWDKWLPYPSDCFSLDWHFNNLNCPSSHPTPNTEVHFIDEVQPFPSHPFSQRDKFCEREAMGPMVTLQQNYY